MHCGVPVLASPLVEIKNIFSKYNIGTLIDSHDPGHIAEKMNYMLSSEERLKTWKQNCLAAARELNWQNEEKVLEEVYFF
jgi:glycosyltransferase involved in cell wall biosynthesis